MIEKNIADFDIDQIAKSGQCFRLNKMETGRYQLISGNHYLEIEQCETSVKFYCESDEWKKIWHGYFDLDADYKVYKESIEETDLYLRRAVNFGTGIRILRQPLWEMIVTFIISQQNNIPRIKKCVESLCTMFGERTFNQKGEEYCTFPDADRLAALEDDGLKLCSLGYRSKYILKSSRMVTSGEVDLERIKSMNYQEAKTELMKLCGVGVKVAECICLFALHHIDAFPIDTHIQKVLDENYPSGFPFERYEGYAGVLQQYAFYYDLYKNVGEEQTA